jgi:hypothetical protein
MNNLNIPDTVINVNNPYSTTPPITSDADRWKHFWISKQPTVRAKSKTKSAPPPTLVNFPHNAQHEILNNDTENDTTHNSPLQRPIIYNNIAWGHELEPSADFTILYQNINGISDSNNWVSTHSYIQDKKINIVGFCETNVEWKHSNFQQRYLHFIRKNYDKQVKIATTTSSLKFDSLYKPGGTCTIALDSTNGSICNHISDSSGQGRWSGFLMQRRHNKQLLVLTAYRVIQRSITTAGPQTVFHQQYTLLQNNSNTNTTILNPRKIFIIDLIKTIQKYTSQGIDIILLIDANESMGQEAKGIAEVCRKCDLIDPIAYQHGTDVDIPSHINGSHQIDFILISRALIPTIKKSGILPFYTAGYSDHRAYHLTLDHRMLFNGEYQTSPTTIGRGLISRQPATIRKYKAKLHKHMMEHNIFNKLQTVSPWDTSQKQWNDIEKIDKQWTIGCLNAEEAVRSRKTGKWSTKIHYIAWQIRYWKISRSQSFTKTDHTPQLEKIRQCLPEEIRDSLVKTTTYRAHIHKLKKELQKVKVDETTHRRNMLEDLANAQALKMNTAAETEIRNLIRREDRRTQFRYIKNAFKPFQQSQIHRILVPDPEGEILIDSNQGATTWKAITDPQTMKSTVLQYNKNHFRNANNTPFMQSPLTEMFSNGFTHEAQQLIDGSLDIESIPTTSLIKAVLKQIQNTRLPVFQSDILKEDVDNAIRKWREETTTSPSGRHLGHYKSLQAADGILQDPTDPTIPIGDQIMQAHVDLLNIIVQSSYSLIRWRKIDSMMLEKIPGTPRIDKLRVIHIYEADYNLFCRIFWAKRMMQHAESNNYISDSQYGGRAGRKAMDMVLQKQLKIEYAHYTKTPIATFDNDAMACYDRMIVPLTSILSQTAGIPPQAVGTLVYTLENAKYHIRTYEGTSDNYYCSTTDQPIQGTGQGNTSSGPLWELFFTIINNTYIQRASCMEQQDPTGTITLNEFSEGFIDDTNLFTNAVNNMRRELTSNAQRWESLLHITGAKLALTKCFYYHLEWSFSAEGVARIKSNDELDYPPLLIKDSVDGSHIEIDIRECSEAHRTLGCWKAMDGNQNQQRNILTEKSKQLGQILARSSLSIQATTIAYSSNYITAMIYPLSATYFSEILLDRIQGHADTHFIPAMGYHQSTPKAVLRATKSIGGVGLRGLYAEQSTTAIMQIIQHLRANTTLGMNIRLHLHWAQMVSGVSKFLLTDTEPHSYSGGFWIPRLREYMNMNNLTLQIENIWIPKMYRLHDCTIMDKAITIYPNAKELRIINRCRLYLKAITLSDICTAEGDFITEYSWNPMKLHQSVKQEKLSSLNYPNQQPPKRGWEVWRKFLKKLTKDTNHKKLITKLGAWKYKHYELDGKWLMYVSQINKTLYIRNDDQQYDEHLVHSESNTQYLFRQQKIRSNVLLPEDSIPVTGTTSSLFVNKIRVFKIINSDIPQITDHQPTTWNQNITSVDPWEYQLLSNIVHHHQNIISDYTNIIFASDGSVSNDNKGAFSWICSINGKSFSHNVGITGGNLQTMTSYRTEAMGVLAYHCYLIRQKELYTGTHHQSTIQCYCDNIGVVKTIKRLYEKQKLLPKQTTIPEFDIIAQILLSKQKLRSIYGLTTIINHVKAHQDSTIQYDKLPYIAQLNCDADRLVGDFVQTITSTDILQSFHRYPASTCQLYYNNTPITTMIPHAVRNAHNLRQYKHYMCHRFKWETEVYNNIDFSTIEAVVSHFSPNDKRRIHKIRCKWLPTMKRRNKEDVTIRPYCPNCPTVNEDHDHIFSCPHPMRQKDLQIAYKNFLTTIRTNTPESILTIFDTAIQSWITKGRITYTTNETRLPPSIESAIEHQNSIGWNNFLHGFISKSWLTTYSIFHYELQGTSNVNKCSHSKTWMNKLQHATLKFSIEVWLNRNQHVYGLTNEEISSNYKKELLTKISYYYDVLSEYPKHQHLMQTQLTDWGNASVPIMTAWLSQAKTVIKKINKQRHVTAPRGDIRAFFQPIISSQ